MKVKQNIDLQQVLDQIQAVVFCINVDGSIIELTGNTAILNLKPTGFTSNLYALFNPSEGKRIQAYVNELSSSTPKASFSISYICKNLKELRFNVVAQLNLQVPGSVVVSFTKVVTKQAIFNDINGYESYKEAIRQLEISEARYDSFFENDPVMHISVDPKTGCIAECNSLTVAKLGHSSKKDIIGQPVYSIFTPEKKQKCLQLLERFKVEGAIQNEEMELRTTSGKSIPILLYTTAQKDEYGNILLSRSTLVDISELKNIQKRIEKKRTYLQLLNNQLEQFVSTCSHDLQEPLATIKFAGDVLNKLYGDRLDDKGRDYLKYIDEAVDRLSDQIKLLLNHARIGKDSERTTVDLNDVITTVIKDLGKRIIDAEAEISIPEKLPNISGYVTELRLLFQNLISNAIKYKKDNTSPQIIIQANEFPEYIEFLISDNGIGIAPEDAKEIFKIFNKVNQTNPNKGTGIGLAHCEKIVQMHSGSIRVKSSLNVGSTFVFTLKKSS